MAKILIIAGGGTGHLSQFEKAAQGLGIEVLTASFSDLEYYALGAEEFSLKVKDEPVSSFDICYIRLVGKQFEKAALLVNYCKQKGIKIVDTVFERKDLLRVPLPKSVEVKLLQEALIPVPDTYFGSLLNIKTKAARLLGFPFVLKETTGKQGHAVWSPRNEVELEKLYQELLAKEKEEKKSFIAQRFIQSSQRSRILMVGDKALAGITRPTRWRKRFTEKINGQYPEGKKLVLDPIPRDQVDLALKAVNVLGIDIAGVDILTDDKTGKLYILEVNSAPRWESVRKESGVDVEKEILLFLTRMVK